MYVEDCFVELRNLVQSLEFIDRSSRKDNEVLDNKNIGSLTKQIRNSE